MKTKQKVPMSLDLRSGYGWELLATFVKRAQDVHWDTPDIGSVVLQALSGDYNTLIETLEPFTTEGQYAGPEKMDSMFVKRTHPPIPVAHLRMLYYFLLQPDPECFDDNQILEREWMTLLSSNEITDIIQFMTDGFARVEFGKLEENNKAKLFPLIQQKSVLYRFMIHALESYLASAMYPVCNQIDCDYLFARCSKAHPEIRDTHHLEWNEEHWNQFRQLLHASPYQLSFGIITDMSLEVHKYDHLDKIQLFTNYDLAWSKYRTLLANNPITTAKIICLFTLTNPLTIQR
jgi:hypothetical protein